MVWVLTVFNEVSREVEYVEVSGGLWVAQLYIHLKTAGPDRTTAEIRYALTALSSKGEEYVEAHRGPLFDQTMADWESELNGYLRRAGRK